jgi:hypothetical protein
VGVGAVSESAVLVAIASVLLAEELGDSGIVVGSVLEGLESVSVAAALADIALFELLEEASVVVGVAEDGNTLVVLGGSADESDTTDVDFLDSLGDADVDLGDSVLEGVEVADDVVNLVDVLVGKVLLVRGEVTGQDTGMDSRVQSLDATSKHLRGLGDGRNVPVESQLALFSHEINRVHLLDREARFSDHLGGTPRGENSNILLDKTFGQVQQTGLVIDRDDGDLLLRGHFGS